MKKNYTRYFRVGQCHNITSGNFSPEESVRSTVECGNSIFKLGLDGIVMISKSLYIGDYPNWGAIPFVSLHRDPIVDNIKSNLEIDFFLKSSFSLRSLKTSIITPHSSIESLIEETYSPHINQMACRSDHIFFLDQNGKDLFGMGNNEDGQLDPTKNESKLGKLFNDENEGCSWCAIRIDLSTVWREITRLHLNDHISMVVCGKSHSGIIFERTGIIVMWGLNDFKQLGSQKTTPFIFVDGFSPLYKSVNCVQRMIVSICGQKLEKTICKPKHKASQIALGYDNTIVCTTSGDVFVWGQDYFFDTISVLCDVEKYLPLHIDVAYLNGQVKSVCVACDRICLCRTNKGELFIWGNKEMENGGTRIRTPTKIKHELNVSRLSGSSICCLIVGTKRNSYDDLTANHEIYQMKETITENTGFIQVHFKFPKEFSCHTQFSISAGKLHSYLLLRELEDNASDPETVEDKDDSSSNQSIFSDTSVISTSDDDVFS